MKIAVYGVSLNEEQNVKTWYESTRSADYHFILDTGSTDKTIEIAKSLGIEVAQGHVSPWSENFAKTTALAMLPKDIDYCLLLDLDEIVIEKDWYEKISKSLTDIVECYRTDHTGLVDEVKKTKARRIHKRFNIRFDGFRAIPTTVVKTNDKNDVLDITISHLAGTQERFSDREPRYVELYKNEYQYLKELKESLMTFRLVNLQNYCLAEFETNNLKSFLILFHEYEELFKEFKQEYNLKTKNDNHDQILKMVEGQYSTLKLANSLIMFKEAKRILQDILTNLSGIDKDFILTRLAILYYLEKDETNYKKTKREYFLNKGNVSEKCDKAFEIMDLSLKNLKEDDLNFLKNFYASIRFGKPYTSFANNTFLFWMKNV